MDYFSEFIEKGIEDAQSKGVDISFEYSMTGDVELFDIQIPLDSEHSTVGLIGVCFTQNGNNEPIVLARSGVRIGGGESWSGSPASKFTDIDELCHALEKIYESALMVGHA